MPAEKLSRPILALAILFGVLDLITAGIFIPFLPKFYHEAAASSGIERTVAALKVLLVALLLVSAAGHLLRRRWGCTVYFVQIPLRMLTNIFSLSVLLYLIPIIGNADAAAGLHLFVVAMEWMRVVLTVKLRRNFIL